MVLRRLDPLLAVPPTSKRTSMIVVPNEFPLLVDSLEGVRSVGAVKWY
jgi:hypothetical protein